MDPFPGVPMVVSRLLQVYLEPATWILVLIVVFIHILSSYRSTTFSFEAHRILAEEAEGSVMTTASIIFIPLIGSVMLIALFYFLGAIYLFLVALFALAAFTSCVSFVFPVVKFMRRRALPRIGDLQSLSLCGKTWRQDKTVNLDLLFRLIVNVFHLNG